MSSQIIMKNQAGYADVEISPCPSSQVDDALRFIRDQSGEEQLVDLSPCAEKELVRKIDWMLMPLMAAMYNLQYLDKTIRAVSLFSIDEMQNFHIHISRGLTTDLPQSIMPM